MFEVFQVHDRAQLKLLEVLTHKSVRTVLFESSCVAFRYQLASGSMLT
jgi:hypothetical protein